jgi:hypothetical protein
MKQHVQQIQFSLLARGEAIGRGRAALMPLRPLPTAKHARLDADDRFPTCVVRKRLASWRDPSRRSSRRST